MLTDTPLSVADVLERAAEKLEAPGAWIKGELYRDAQGIRIHTPETAVCFCMAGAVIAAGTDMGANWDAAWDFLDNTLPDAQRASNTAAFNDAPERTQPEVVAALRRAATLARAGDA